MRRNLAIVMMVLATLFVRGESRAATNYVGKDYAGADLTVANGDSVSGVFTNVGTFTIAAGANVSVASNMPLEIHAATIMVAGALSATGAGSPPAAGTGAGGPGSAPFSCGAGGGGGGYGGVGGRDPSSSGGTAGTTYGTAGGSDDALGSGGGKGGTTSNSTGGNGGGGGGSILLDAPLVTVSGSLFASGVNGTDASNVVPAPPAGAFGAGGGGGGSGGTIHLQGGSVTVSGTVRAKGGNGASFSIGATCSGGPGGGGGGGRVKVVASSASAFTPDVSGGLGATSGSSGSFNVDVSSVVTIASAANPSLYGEPVTLTAHVTGGASGNVRFKDGAAVLATVALDPTGDASYVASTLGVGAHALSVAYDGDATHLSRSSAPLVQTVNQGASSTALVSSQNPSIAGTNVTFTATVSSIAPAQGAPTGSVTFKDSAATIGAAPLVNGVAVLNIGTLGAGAHDISAVYAATTNHGGSTSAPVTQTISKDSDTIAIRSSANPSTYGDAISLVATVSSGVSPATPTGTVTFKDGSTVLGGAPLVNGVATLSTSTLAGGSHPVTALYNGDDIHVGGGTASLTQKVSTAAVVVALASTTSEVVAGKPVTLSVAVMSPTGKPTGVVELREGGTVLATTTIDASSKGALTTSTLAAGGHDLVAAYLGDASFSTGISTVVKLTVSAPTSSPSTPGDADSGSAPAADGGSGGGCRTSPVRGLGRSFASTLALLAMIFWRRRRARHA